MSHIKFLLYFNLNIKQLSKLHGVYFLLQIEMKWLDNYFIIYNFTYRYIL